MTDRHLVDYEAGADRYRAHREPSDTVLAQWRATIEARLGADRPRLVVDAGCGTGAFLRLWQTIGAGRIVAVDPSPAMRAKAQERGVAGATVVAGVLNAIPIPPRHADVVWVSAVLHHVPDRFAAFREVERMLSDDGRLMIRGFVPGSSHVPWFGHMPGAARAALRFPTLAEITSLAEDAGLSISGVDTVTEGAGVAASAAAAWIDEMRETDSLLTALQPHEIEAGRRALEEHGGMLDPLALTLITIRRATPPNGRVSSGRTGQ